MIRYVNRPIMLIVDWICQSSDWIHWILIEFHHWVGCLAGISPIYVLARPPLNTFPLRKLFQWHVKKETLLNIWLTSLIEYNFTDNEALLTALQVDYFFDDDELFDISQWLEPRPGAYVPPDPRAPVFYRSITTCFTRPHVDWVCLLICDRVRGDKPAYLVQGPAKRGLAVRAIELKPNKVFITSFIGESSKL